MTCSSALVCLGHGWLLKFAQGLQKECDRQSRKIIEEFKSTRKFSQLVVNIRDSMAITHKSGGSDR